ncbi:MAG TPA: hypothetical protein VF691_12175, partial [Cytophagaceae bacterium]
GDPNIFFCFGDKTRAVATTTGGTNFKFYWNNSSTGFIKNDTTLTINEEGSLPWSVMAVNTDNNCRAWDNTTYNLRKRLPDPQLPDSAVTCFNKPITLNVTADPEFKTFEWFYKGVKISNAGGSSFDAARKGQYKVKVYNSLSCARFDSTVVDSVGDFVLNLPSQAAFCANPLNPPKLDAGPSTGFNFAWTPGGSTEPTLAPTASGIYSVIKTSKYGGCRKSATSNITYVPYTSTGINDTIKCPENSIVLSLNTSLLKDFLWQDGKTTSTYTVAAQKSGKFTVQYKTLTGDCQYSDEITVAHHAIDTLELGIDSITVCNYDGFTLNATDKYVSYNWSPDAGDGFPIYRPISSGSHNVVVVDKNKCTQSDNALVRIVPISDPNIGPDTSLCSEHEFLYRVTATSYDRYVWHNGSTDYKYFPKPGDSLVYVKVYKTLNNVTCFHQDSAIVKVVAPINVSFNEFETPICSDDRFELQALVDRNIYKGAIKNYLWLDRGKAVPDTLGKQSSIIPNFSRIYTVVVTGENNCIGTNEADIVYFDSVPATLPNPNICAGTPFTFYPGRGFDSYVWTAFHGDSI